MNADGGGEVGPGTGGSRALDEALAFEFCTRCNWAYFCWEFHQGLFHRGHPSGFAEGRAVHDAMGRLSIVTQEYCLLQIARLFDPAQKGKFECLSVEFVVKRGKWQPEVLQRLEELAGFMEKFVGPTKPTASSDDAVSQSTAPVDGTIRRARNKIIAHADLDAFSDGSDLGSFRMEDGEAFFRHLQEFVNLVWQGVAKRDYPFDRNGRHESKALFDALDSGAKILPSLRPIPR